MTLNVYEAVLFCGDNAVDDCSFERQGRLVCQPRKNNELDYTAFFERSPLSYQSLDPDGQYLDVNSRWEETFGYRRAEIIGHEFSELMTAESEAAIAHHFATLKKEGEIRDAAFELVHKDGHTLLVNLHGRANYDEEGHFLNSHCVLIDVTEMRRAETQLIESEEKNRFLSQQLQALLDGVPDRILFLDPELKILWTNQQKDLNGQPFKKNPEGQLCYEMLHQRIVPCSDCPAVECFITGKHTQFERTNSDGMIWSRRAFPVFDEHGDVTSVIEIGQDITETVKLRKETARNGQLATLGELAAGVAHEINNPITGIINCAQLLKNCSSVASREYDLAERITNDADRIEKIVKQLLFHARNDRDDMAFLNITDILSGSLELVGSQFNSDGIDIQVALEEGLPKVYGNTQQLQQLFLNILSNSRYALNQRYPHNDSEKRIEVKLYRDEVESGPLITMRCYDHGIGIPAELLNKVLHPFITSKPAAEGTGLGLSISNDIVNNHGGTLTITSEINKYTEVVIQLPIPP